MFPQTVSIQLPTYSPRFHSLSCPKVYFSLSELLIEPLTFWLISPCHLTYTHSSCYLEMLYHKVLLSVTEKCHIQLLPMPSPLPLCYKGQIMSSALPGNSSVICQSHSCAVSRFIHQTTLTLFHRGLSGQLPACVSCQCSAPPWGPFLSLVLDCFTVSLLLAENRDAGESCVTQRSWLTGWACLTSSAWLASLTWSSTSFLTDSLNHWTQKLFPLIASHLQPPNLLGFSPLVSFSVLTSVLNHVSEAHPSLGEPR